MEFAICFSMVPDEAKSWCVVQAECARDAVDKAVQMHPGSTIHGCFKYVTRGISDGRNHLTWFSFEGEFVADYPCVLSGKPSLATIEAMMPCRVWRVSGEELLQFFVQPCEHSQFKKAVPFHIPDQLLQKGMQALVRHDHCVPAQRCHLQKRFVGAVVPSPCIPCRGRNDILFFQKTAGIRVEIKGQLTQKSLSVFVKHALVAHSLRPQGVFQNSWRQLAPQGR